MKQPLVVEVGRRNRTLRTDEMCSTRECSGGDGKMVFSAVYCVRSSELFPFCDTVAGGLDFCTLAPLYRDLPAHGK